MFSLTEEGADARRESRLRSLARRQGYAVRRCRGRNPWALDFGRYHVEDPFHNEIVAGGHVSGYSMTLDDVEAFLAAD